MAIEPEPPEGLRFRGVVSLRGEWMISCAERHRPEAVTTDGMRLLASARQAAIALGIASLTLGVAFATVYLVGPITPEQSARLNVALGVLVVAATAAATGLAVFVGLTRERTARGAPVGVAGPGLLLCLLACGATMVLAVTGMAMRVGSPIETAGEAIFTTHGGEVQGVQERIRVPLPPGWRFRYGRQAWREGTLIDERGHHVLSFAVSIAPAYFGDSLRSFAAERERGAAKQRPGVKGRFRDGPRGLQWMIDIAPGPSSRRGAQIAEQWGPEVLYFLMIVLPQGSDLDPAAIADRLSLAAEIPARGQ